MITKELYNYLKEIIMWYKRWRKHNSYKNNKINFI